MIKSCNLVYKTVKRSYNKIMKETRHEEYAHISNNLPFILLPNLVRTPSTCRAEKNWHDNIEIQVCLDGEGEVLLDGDKFPFTKGDIAVVNSNVIHYTYTPCSLTYTCLIVDTSFCKQMDIDYQSLDFESLFKNQKIYDKVEILTKAYYDENTPCKVAFLTQTILEILIEIINGYSKTKSSEKAKPLTYERVKQTIKFVRENYNKKLTLDELSKVVYCDKFTLSRDFKKITGQTIVNYVNSFRCQKAAELLESGESVIQTAYKCGFDNPSFFSKTFKKYIGNLPSKYKK